MSRLRAHGPAVLLAILVPLYFVIGLLTNGRRLFAPELALDRLVPVEPAWALVYGSLYVFAFLPLFVIRRHDLLRRTVLAYVIAVIVSYIGFLVYPTAAPRPPRVIGEDFFAWSLRVIYSLDTPYNCFPSLHVAYSFLSALTCYRVHRGLGLVALLWATLIGVSTLYTKQHYILDVLAGVLVAYAAYAVLLRSYPREATRAVDRRLAPVRAVTAIGIFGIVVASFWVTYVRAAT